MTTLIHLDRLSKSYGAHRGIIDVACDIAEGEVFGFLGPNGAGKTTTMRLLMGLLKPTSGQASIAGLDCWKQSTAVKRLVGYLPGEYAFDPGMTGAQIIAYLGHLRGGVDRSYVNQLVKRLDLDLSKRFREYSRGNKQKIGLVQAFMHHPRLLILDEPTSGLDPLNQQEFYKMISEIRTSGHTVFLSSHILPEVEHTCERVGIIREGRLIQVSEVSSLKHLRQNDVEVSFARTADPAWFTQLPDVLNVKEAHSANTLRLTTQGDLKEVIKVAAQHDATNVVVQEPSLEDVFLRFYTPEQVMGTADAKARPAR